jgi:predicted CopG family antitoxin
MCVLYEAVIITHKRIKYTNNTRIDGLWMAHKTITISEEAYDVLAGYKTSGESFTEVIIRLLGQRRRGTLLEYRGRWVGSDEEFGRIFKEIEAIKAGDEVRVAESRSA